MFRSVRAAAVVLLTGLSLSTAVGISPARAVDDPAQALEGATWPDAPTDVTAVAGNRSAVVSWTPPADDGGADITYYVVSTWAGGTPLWKSTTTGTSIFINGLTNGIAYSFTVMAVNAVSGGFASLPSAPVTPRSDYQIAMFDQPINDGPGSPQSSFKLNSTIPVKFTLLDRSGNRIADSDAQFISDSCHLTIGWSRTDGTPGGITESVSNSSASSGDCFRYDTATHAFIFNLSTKGFAAGANYRIAATIAQAHGEALLRDVVVGVR